MKYQGTNCSDKNVNVCKRIITVHNGKHYHFFLFSRLKILKNCTGSKVGLHFAKLTRSYFIS